MPAIREVMIKIMSLIMLTISINAVGADAKNDVVFETNKGTIVVTLNAEKAPGTVANFKSYVESGFYNDTIFHRVIPGFMIQGGGFGVDIKRKPTQTAIQNEANNGLKNKVGTISMARTGDPHSATSQFFINVNDNVNLDHVNTSLQGWGYAVFGQVVEGLELVIEVSRQATQPQQGHLNMPVDPVIIEKAFLR